MLGLGLHVVLTALLASVLTWVMAYLYFKAKVEKRLEERLLHLQEEFEARVKAGAMAAGRELLPALREQVRLGFIDAVNRSSAAGLVEDTARVVSTGAGLVESGLNALLNIGKPTKR